MIVLAALGIVVKLQRVVWIREHASPVVPDNHLGVSFHVFPQPADIQPVVICDARRAHAAVACLLAKLLLPLGKALAAVGQVYIRHLMDHIAAVKTQGHVAHHALAVELAHPADDQVLAGRRLVIGLLVVGQAGGNRAARPVLSINKHMQLLRQLVDDDAVLLVGRNGL